MLARIARLDDLAGRARKGSNGLETDYQICLRYLDRVILPIVLEFDSYLKI